MTDRERLIELIVNADVHDSYECKLCMRKDISCVRCDAEKNADYLLANGVIVPPCKVGDKVYSLRETSCEDIDGVHTECEYYGFGTDDRICTLEKPQKCPHRYRVFKCLVTEYNLLSFARLWGKTVFFTKEQAEAKLKELQK